MDYYDCWAEHKNNKGKWVCEYTKTPCDVESFFREKLCPNYAWVAPRKKPKKEKEG